MTEWLRRWLVAIGMVHFISILVQLHRHRKNTIGMFLLETSASKSTTPTFYSEYYFHHARPDRSGAVLEDMLLAHAHSFYNNLSYGGACTMSPLPHQASHDEMIHLLGLQKILKFACPTNASALERRDPPIHRRFNTRIFRKEWLSAIRSDHLRYRSLPVRRQLSTGKRKVVVHIRRGDVSLCDPATTDRYLPNQHYISLIEALKRNNNDHPISIEVFSEERSDPEGWKGLLQQLGSMDDLSLHLNVSASIAWSSMVQADVLITSKSSFSFVPAIFAVNEVIYTPFWLDPLPHWTIVDEHLMQTMRRTKIRLHHELCNTTTMD